MNFIFKSYPEHPWFTEWTLEPRDCKASFRGSNAHLFFQTQEIVGRIAPNVENPEWVLQIPVPQNARINMLFNGFCAYFDKKKKHLGTETLVPEPGILWGRTTGIPTPELASDLPVESENGFQWLEGDFGSALLVTRNETFCLVTKCRLRNDAEQIAETYLSKDLEAILTEELARREGANTLFEEMVHHDSMAAICAESMMKALRPAEGHIPFLWCQSSETPDARFDLNELPPLALAWRLIDIEVAEELMLCATKIQTNAGAIAVHFSPHATNSTLEAPKPFLAKTAEQIWDVRKSDKLLTQLLPPLRRHIQWLLHHFDPKRDHHYCWKNRNEPIVPEIYQTDLASVDLTVLLITEIEALNRLRKQSTLYGNDADFFCTELETLTNNLLNLFWNTEESAFTKAYVRDKEARLRGFTSFTPLLWHNLPDPMRVAILDPINESGKLPGGLSVLSWRKNALDDASFPLLQQLMVFQALNIADPHGQLLGDFSRITLQGFVEWHSLSLQEINRLHISPVLAAYIMNVQAIRQYRYHAQGQVTGYFFKILRKVKADRQDLGIIAATLFSVYSIHLLYSVLKAPPPMAMLEAQMNAAYADRDGQGTLENCLAIVKYYPSQSNKARLLAANIALQQNNYTTAEMLYRDVRKEYPDCPGAMIALGLTCQLQGNFKEAEENYYEFCYIFEDIFPELVGEINTWRKLAREGFKSPPKWREIYRYQLMHELE